MVEEVLREVPNTRNSDIDLTIEIWKKYFPDKVIIGKRGDAIYLRHLHSLPREDNVKRIRAQFNSEEKYYPTDPKVAKARGIEEDKWRAVLGYPPKEVTQYPTKRPSYMDTRPKTLF